jgi:Permuted papain-like amidase enzyme, YaeF/YiiX, C92 family
MLRLMFSLALFLRGAGDGLEPTDRLVPPGWQGNPWGPEATRAREDGEIPPLELDPTMKQWEQWGRQVLKEGDIVFRLGDARVFFGRFPFSRFIAKVNNSPFSHTGIVAIEQGEPVVYDTTKAGVRRQPFCVWVLDNIGPIGVKRLRPELRARIGGVLGFCRDVYARQVPFDYNLDPDDRALYCVEMTEKAFRSAGIALSEPIRLGDMERAPRYPIRIGLFWLMAAVTLDKPLSLEQPVFFPGNERNGIWSSQFLESIYPRTPLGGAAGAADATTQARPSSASASAGSVPATERS